MATTSPGSTPWWTDQEAQNPNVGGAGADYTQVQNPSTSTLGISPQYLQALQAMGYRGGMPNTPQGYQALQQFIQQHGLTSKTSFLDQQGTGDQISALFDANGNQAPGTQRQYASDVNSDAFLGGIFGATGFGAAAALGAGAGVAGVGGSTAGGGGGLAGTGLPEYSAYGGVGSGASAPLAGDATGTGIFGSGAAADGAGGVGLAEGATPAGLGGSSGGLLGSGSGILGSSVTGGDVMGGLGSAAKFASSPGGGALIGAGLGLLGNKSGLNSATNSTQNVIDPNLKPYIYGSNGQGGLVGDVNSLYKQQMATGGLNANQTAGLNSQLSVLNNPNYSTGFNQERALGSSLLNQGVAGNPFTGSGTAYAGTPQFTAQPSAPMTQPGQPPSLLQKPYGPMSGVPNRVAPGGLLGA